ncbi:hypothetical protein WJX74_002663 [Apatococcus lobatus]|uniref:Aminopeptidase N n=1 Tax=Apatococcus lobatus TaxID=904363 RepID=A0AAW1SE93_9CHLO
MHLALLTAKLPARLRCPSHFKPALPGQLLPVGSNPELRAAYRSPLAALQRPIQPLAARYLTIMQASTATAQADAPEAQIDNIDVKVPSTPTTIYRKDYKPTPYQVDQVDLTFQLHEDATVVMSRLQMRPTTNGSGGPAPIVFNGRDDMKLWSISINGKQLSSGDYKLDPKTLTIPNPPLATSLWRSRPASSPRRTPPWRASTSLAATTAHSVKLRASGA